MLKSKGSLYFLFPVVVFIWGAIIYKMVASFEDEAAVFPEITVDKPLMIREIENEGFSLLPVEKDPFLGYYYKKPIIQKPKVKNINKKITWPEVTYLGIITGQGKASAVYILQINGKQVLVQKGGTFEGLSIVSASSEKIKLKFQGESILFSKTE